MLYAIVTVTEISFRYWLVPIWLENKQVVPTASLDHIFFLCIISLLFCNIILSMWRYNILSSPRLQRKSTMSPLYLNQISLPSISWRKIALQLKLGMASTKPLPCLMSIILKLFAICWYFGKTVLHLHAFFYKQNEFWVEHRCCLIFSRFQA